MHTNGTQTHYEFRTTRTVVPQQFQTAEQAKKWLAETKRTMPSYAAALTLFEVTITAKVEQINV